jgi:hypothetical protein
MTHGAEKRAERSAQVELIAPDISAHRSGNCGIDYVYEFDSGKRGHNVVVQALTHGNELCGAIALDWLLGQNIQPRHGKLTVVFANVEAFSRWDPADPDASRFVDEDFNRVWSDETLKSSRDSVDIWSIVRIGCSIFIRCMNRANRSWCAAPPARAAKRRRRWRASCACRSTCSSIPGTLRDCA